MRLKSDLAEFDLFSIKTETDALKKLRGTLGKISLFPYSILGKEVFRRFENLIEKMKLPEMSTYPRDIPINIWRKIFLIKIVAGNKTDLGLNGDTLLEKLLECYEKEEASIRI
jgi:hypothetical protein